MRHLLTLLLLISLAPTSAWADFKRDYQNGVDAYARGDWLETRRLMQAAIRANPTPAARMRTYGTNFIPYIPHHYLGLSEARLGDCNAALAAFKIPASQGVVAGLASENREQASQITRCEQVLLAQQSPPPAPPQETPPVAAVTPAQPAPSSSPVLAGSASGSTTPAPVRPAVTQTAPPVTPLSRERIAPVADQLARAASAIRDTDARLRAAPLAGTGDARGLARDLDGLRRERDAQESTLERARSSGNSELLASVTRDSASLQRNLQTLAERVDSARSGLLQAQAARTLEQSRQRATTVASRLSQLLLAAGDAGIAEHPAVSPAKQRQQALQAALQANDAAAIERESGAASRQVEALENAIAAAPKPAPEALRSLVAAYLAARFDQAASWDRLDDLPDESSRAHALLLRAAARWHLYVRSGEQDASLGAAVDSDLRQAKRLHQSLQPNARAFSPRLLERYAAL